LIAMFQKLLLALIALFFLIYFLKAVLMLGYEYFKYRNKSGMGSQMAGDLLKVIVYLKPLLQKKLQPKGYDFKMYKRYQTKNLFYYTALWVLLFMILFLCAKIYLELF
jgi:Zn-dependent protease